MLDISTSYRQTSLSLGQNRVPKINQWIARFIATWCNIIEQTDLRETEEVTRTSPWKKGRVSFSKDTFVESLQGSLEFAECRLRLLLYLVKDPKHLL